MFLPIEKIIKERLERQSSKGEILALNICQMWAGVYKEVIKKSPEKARVLYFKNKILYIKVQNVVLFKEFQLKKEKLIKAINKRLKNKLVKNIIFKI
ncbi:MAG TPA: DUF721 domain-containing protein [bacterium]|nr:DUF721 domain-containing protein [bacterium]